MSEQKWLSGHGGTLAISWGEYGGFYWTRLGGWKRLCLGRVALTYIDRDLDALLNDLVDAEREQP